MLVYCQGWWKKLIPAQLLSHVCLQLIVYTQFFWRTWNTRSLRMNAAQRSGRVDVRRWVAKENNIFFWRLIYFLYRSHFSSKDIFEADPCTNWVSNSHRRAALCEDRQNGTEITEKWSWKLPNGWTAWWRGVENLLQMEWKSNLAWHSQDGKYCMKFELEWRAREEITRESIVIISSDCTFVLMLHGIKIFLF